MPIHKLPTHMREKLKEPLGVLIRGSFEETMKELGRMIDKEKPVKIVAVGDAVSENMMKHGFHPHILIVDNKVMRNPIQPIKIETHFTLYAKNPPGTLTDDALKTVKEAMKQTRHTRIVIDGEEDLLTLAAVLNAPNGSFVVYGQPHEGIVVVKVSEQKKREIQGIVDSMEYVSKS
ncbi:MAG: DUF359 domain-containing protein [Candidatus Bathyarchaeia archaeon]